MTKGKPWPLEEEKKLRALFDEKKSIEAMVQALGKTKGAIYAKLDELGLKVEATASCKTVATTSKLQLSKELLFSF